MRHPKLALVSPEKGVPGTCLVKGHGELSSAFNTRLETSYLRIFACTVHVYTLTIDFDHQQPDAYACSSATR